MKLSRRPTIEACFTKGCPHLKIVQCSSRSLEKAGRIRVKGKIVVIYLDGIGSFQVGIAQVISVLLQLGN